MGFISMTEPSTLAEKAISRPNAAWNSESSEPSPSLVVNTREALLCMQYAVYWVRVSIGPTVS